MQQIAAFVGRAWTAVLFLFDRAYPGLRRVPLPEPAPLPVPPTPADIAAPSPPRRIRTPRPPTPAWQYGHVKGLLDELPIYREQFVKLKRHDSDAYNFHRQVGARILPFNLRELMPTKEAKEIPPLHPKFKQHMPGFGLVFCGAVPKEKHEKRWCDFSFMHFNRLARPPWFAPAPSGDTLYVLHWIGTNWTDETAIEARYHVAVGAEGAIRLIHERFAYVQQLPKGGTINHWQWGAPPEIKQQYAAMKREGRTDLRNAEELAIAMFHVAANCYCLPMTDGFQITAERDGVAMGFTIPERRSAAFFLDRDLTLTAHGKTARIFHMVDAHSRTLASGKVVDVASHYRGLRRFAWQGENVRIDPPEQAIYRYADIGTIWEADVRMGDGKTTANPVFGRVVRRLAAKRAEQRGGYRTIGTRPPEERPNL